MRPSKDCLAKRKILLLGALMGALYGCATKAPPRPAVARPAAGAPSGAAVRLAVLPSDPLLFADIASALDEQLGRAQVAGARTMVRAKISMEVAQLALECVSPTDDCYAQVGRYLQVDRLLWGKISRDGANAGVKVTVVLLDVGRAAQVGRAEESFPKSTDAIEGLRKLVERAAGAPMTVSAPAPSGALSQRERAP